MADLNDIAIFQKAASFSSFTLAARTLGLPKSTISRAVARLESELGVRLFERGARSVRLTTAGEAFRSRCESGLAQLADAIASASSQASAPRGRVRVSGGIGFGLKLLSAQLPGFLERYPKVQMSVELSSAPADLVTDGVDVAIRMGPLDDSGLAATRLGSLSRYLCASPAYVARHGRPRNISELAGLDTIEMPTPSNRPRVWTFSRRAEKMSVNIAPRVSSNEALLMIRLIEAGVGIGIISGYLCADAIESGRLVVLLPEWRPPSVEVSLVFPGRRKVSPPVRAFIDYLREVNGPDVFWKREPQVPGA